MIQKCGRSGVELHQIRTAVDSDGNDIVHKGKPNNGYLDGRRAGKGGAGWNANRPTSCGAGLSPMQVAAVVEEISPEAGRLLLDIHKGTSQGLPKANPLAKKLAKLGLAEWEKGAWTHTIEGDQVARRLKEAGRA